MTFCRTSYMHQRLPWKGQMSSTQPVRIPILVENASVEEPNKIPIERLSKATKLGPPNNNNCVQSRGWKTKVSTDDVDFVNSHMEVTLKAPSSTSTNKIP